MSEQASRAVVEMDVPAPMRDGTRLYADIYRPEGDGPFPALLQRTPYDKRQIGAPSRPLNVRLAIARGFAVVIQDVRGRFASEGAFHTFVNEADDGYDTVEWVAGLPWCSGRVGMIGPSYVGATQWLAASARPPHLSGIFPMVTASDYHEGWTYQGGVFSLGFNVSWCIRPLAAANSQHLKAEHGLGDAEASEMVNAMDHQEEAFRALPLTGQPWLRRDTSSYFYEWLEHPSDDEYWQQMSIERAHPSVTVPSFNVGGWYDIFLKGTIRNYKLMRQNGGSEEARNGSRLLIGPWSHSTIANNMVGDVDFSHRATAAGLFLDDVTMRWYDHQLRGQDNG
ncbi:MAG: CocE/NonD family hydrolase, partial [Chloroflexota bacterium]